jgi:hypothetical protein
MSRHSDHWVEMQPFGPDTVRIEMTRCGHLWHGQAARLVSRNMVERNPLATAIGADFEAVRYQVLQHARDVLTH